MSYPTDIDSFKPLKNRGEVINNEAHTIPSSTPYIVEVDYPILSNVTIPGFTEVTGTPNANEFRVDYNTTSIYFNSANAGTAITITYTTTGSPVVAENVNNLQTSVVNIEETLGTQPQGSHTSVKDRLDVIESSVGHTHQDWEQPQGAIDGSNKVFVLSTVPSPETSVIVILNGLTLIPDEDYIVSGNQLNLIEAPDPGDVLRVRYRK